MVPVPISGTRHVYHQTPRQSPCAAARPWRWSLAYGYHPGPHTEVRLRADARGCDGGLREELAAGIGQRFYARLRGRPLGRRRGDGASVLEAPCWNLPYAQALKPHAVLHERNCPLLPLRRQAHLRCNLGLRSNKRTSCLLFMLMRERSDATSFWKLPAIGFLHFASVSNEEHSPMVSEAVGYAGCA